MATALFAATSVSGQDVVVRSEVDGAPLPSAYHEAVARQPRLFTFTRAWASRSIAAGGPVEGTLPLLVLPALFADSGTPHVSPGDLQRILFDGPSEPGTLTQFYTELSRGRLTVTGRVAPWVRTHLTLAEVTGGQAGLGSESRIVEYLWRALQEADASLDLGRFDNDGPDGVPNSGDDDGVVDAVAFEFLEISASCGGPGIWPHRSAISWWNDGAPYTSADLGPGGPIEVDSYIIQSVSDCTGSGVQTANVIAHEMGHVLGLPDLYHPIDGTLPTERRWVVGCWGLMAAGSWGCGDPNVRVEAFGPVRMSPWSLAQLGWVGFQEPPSDARYAEFRIPPTLDGGQPLRIPLDDDGQESLVLEYRVREGFDRPLPAQGLVAYRWNESGVLRPARESGQPYRFRLMEGDGLRDLLSTHPEGGNRGEAKDVLGFPGNAPLIAATTRPSTTLDSGSPSTVTIHRVSTTGHVARAWISTAPTPAVVEVGAPEASLHSPFLHSHRIGGGALPYRMTSAEAPGWLSVSATLDRLDLRGVPDAEGDAPIRVTIVDALGTEVEWTGHVDVGPFHVEASRLARAVIAPGASTLTTREAAELDARGNGNGRLDIGDVRAHLRGG